MTAVLLLAIAGTARTRSRRRAVVHSAVGQKAKAGVGEGRGPARGAAAVITADSSMKLRDIVFLSPGGPAGAWGSCLADRATSNALRG